MVFSMMVQGTFGMVQGTFRMVQGTFRILQGTFDIFQGTFGHLQGTFRILQGTLGIFQGTFPPSAYFQVIFEIPLFQWAREILRLIGHGGCLLVAYFCYFVRVWGYTMLTPETVNRILFLEALHGFTFALLWNASVEYARQVSPPSHQKPQVVEFARQVSPASSNWSHTGYKLLLA
jgi:hypothetical protein